MSRQNGKFGGMGLGMGLGGGGGERLGPELIPGTSSTLMRRGDWSVSGEDATHIVTDVAGGIRYESDTTMPQLSMIAVGILDIGTEYRVVVSGLSDASGSTKTDSFAGNIIPLSNGTFDVTASSTAFNITRNTINVDTEIGAISIKEKL